MVKPHRRERSRFLLVVYVRENKCDDSVLRYPCTLNTVVCHFTLTRSIGPHPGKSIWLFGAIGKTQDFNQPVSRYTLDNRSISTIVADVRNETSYNELFAYFYDLDSSYHTLFVENIDEGSTLFLDYYLVEPIPPNQLTKSTGNLQTGGEPLRTSISEQPMLTAGPGSSGNAPVGTIVGAVIGSVFAALLVGIVAFVLWRRKNRSKPYYYKSATVYEVLSDGIPRFLPTSYSRN